MACAPRFLRFGRVKTRSLSHSVLTELRRSSLPFLLQRAIADALRRSFAIPTRTSSYVQNKNVHKCKRSCTFKIWREMLERHWCQRIIGNGNYKILELLTFTSNAWTYAAFCVHFLNVNHDKNIHEHPTVGCVRQNGKSSTLPSDCPLVLPLPSGVAESWFPFSPFLQPGESIGRDHTSFLPDSHQGDYASFPFFPFLPINPAYSSSVTLHRSCRNLSGACASSFPFVSFVVPIGDTTDSFVWSVVSRVRDLWGETAESICIRSVLPLSATPVRSRRVP